MSRCCQQRKDTSAELCKAEVSRRGALAGGQRASLSAGSEQVRPGQLLI